MQTKRKQETKKYPQWEGNVALADESLGLLQKPKAKTFPSLVGVVQDITEEAPEADGLGLATGIVVGTGLSIMLWCFIFFVIYLLRLNL